jgi:hypothetical protein
MNKIEFIKCRGRLKYPGGRILWIDNTYKIIDQNINDFIFMLENNSSFPKNFKFIQDNNDIVSLRIDEIEEVNVDNYYQEHYKL